MGLIRRLARVLLSGIFISGGMDVLRHPEPRAVIAGPFIERLRPFAPVLPSDPVLVVRANAAFQIAAGATLAVGILPLLSALALGRVARPDHPRRSPLLGDAGTGGDAAAHPVPQEHRHPRRPDPRRLGSEPRSSGVGDRIGGPAAGTHRAHH
jgi:DoxX